MLEASDALEIALGYQYATNERTERCAIMNLLWRMDFIQQDGVNRSVVSTEPGKTMLLTKSVNRQDSVILSRIKLANVLKGVDVLCID